MRTNFFSWLAPPAAPTRLSEPLIVPDTADAAIFVVPLARRPPQWRDYTADLARIGCAAARPGRLIAPPDSADARALDALCDAVALVGLHAVMLYGDHPQAFEGAARLIELGVLEGTVMMPDGRLDWASFIAREGGEPHAQGIASGARFARLFAAGVPLNPALAASLEAGKIETALALIEAGAYPDLRDGLGNSVLHHICHPARAAEPQAVLKEIERARRAGTQIFSANSAGVSPLKLIEQHGPTLLAMLRDMLAHQAEAGCGRSMVDLSVILLLGPRGIRDKAQAHGLALRAAQRGEPAAYTALGDICLEGMGVAQGDRTNPIQDRALEPDTHLKLLR